MTIFMNTIDGLQNLQSFISKFLLILVCFFTHGICHHNRPVNG